ncbi:hypothetical protein [Clostridium perfringens]|nr:hypothetical protein [Clostridium perfringens]MDH2475977.1 hypothetical protein [Clostridium perfringens]
MHAILKIEKAEANINITSTYFNNLKSNNFVLDGIFEVVDTST